MSDHTAFSELTEEILDRIYAVNFKGVVFLTQKLLPLVNDGGRIINISTGLTRFTTPNAIPYASLTVPAVPGGRPPRQSGPMLGEARGCALFLIGERGTLDPDDAQRRLTGAVAPNA